MSKILEILQTSSDETLAQKIVESYADMQKNFLLKKPKYSGLDAGHFVEAIRRFLELKLFGSYTPLEDSLRKFNEAELQRYAGVSGLDSYRLIIPRIIFSIYTLRNKRGIGHLSGADPSGMDSNFLSSSCKWVLAEIIRTESGLAEAESLVLIEKIVNRDIPIIWKTADFSIITDTVLSTKDKILVLLLDEDGLSFEKIKAATRYANVTRLRAYIRMLGRSGYVHAHDSKIYLSPSGQIEAERILVTNGMLKSI